ncbi:hypothetical protein MGYG_02330 [Nannizzia gypsea CBS 118893]|uniref:Uncharacterized protein n=1 Tax=Arthroderma gypseum (strain ATCC MYA-4604 / CBS 118893) TaxID=535722 RepID=E4UR42_ARTGP|nr:hypothetical protein MGYG_02330 [Nannizzia gypsea CBS 118893]EFQ99317.1 hypothetical protein MGYG_02330 [Nannizzia gypsea CBS 118893]
MKFEAAEPSTAYHISNSTAPPSNSFPATTSATTEYPEASTAEYVPSATGLSALASAASDQTSYIRAYDNADNSNSNHNASQSVNYATSAPTATNGGQGSTTVSTPCSSLRQPSTPNLYPSTIFPSITLAFICLLLPPAACSTLLSFLGIAGPGKWLGGY